MAKRGEIRNRGFATQIRDYTGLLYKYNITPTDIDGGIDFNDTLYVFLEYKHGDAMPPGGQMKFYTRLGQRLCSTDAYCLILIAHHQSEDDIDCANAIVAKFFWNGRWRTPKRKPTTVRCLVDAALREAGLERYILDNPI